MYDTESMTLDYCGQMCQGLHETNFMGMEVYNRAYESQMLGCGAHVRIIALPHVRCACGSACGNGFGSVRAL